MTKCYNIASDLLSKSRRCSHHFVEGSSIVFIPNRDDMS